MGVLPRAAIRVHTTSSVRRRAVTATKVIPSTITAAVVVLGNVATTAVTVRFVLRIRADATTPRPRVTTSLATDDEQRCSFLAGARGDFLCDVSSLRTECNCGRDAFDHTRSSQCLSTLLLGEVGGV